MSFDATLAAVQKWVEACQTQVLDTQLRTPPDKRTHILSIEGEGPKFWRIVSTDYGQRSVWAFVAKKDGESKALGKYREGDIFKAAGWISPAKHARGNVHEDLPLCGIKKWTGPEYLR